MSYSVLYWLWQERVGNIVVVLSCHCRILLCIYHTVRISVPRSMCVAFRIGAPRTICIVNLSFNDKNTVFMFFRVCVFLTKSNYIFIVVILCLLQFRMNKAKIKVYASSIVAAFEGFYGNAYMNAAKVTKSQQHLHELYASPEGIYESHSRVSGARVGQCANRGSWSVKRCNSLKGTVDQRKTT